MDGRSGRPATCSAPAPDDKRSVNGGGPAEVWVASLGRMTSEPALHVLRDIWRAREQTGAELDELLGHGKVCKAMRHISFASDPVDDDLRTAWRDRLEREGKLRPDATGIAELVRPESP